MAISQAYYDLEIEIREKHGEEWFRALPDDDPMVIAIRNSLGVSIRETGRRAVKAYDKGKFIGEFPNAKQCAEELELEPQYVYMQLKGKRKIVKKRYTFEYVEE